MANKFEFFSLVHLIGFLALPHDKQFPGAHILLTTHLVISFSMCVYTSHGITPANITLELFATHLYSLGTNLLMETMSPVS